MLTAAWLEVRADVIRGVLFIGVVMLALIVAVLLDFQIKVTAPVRDEPVTPLPAISTPLTPGPSITPALS